MTTEKKFFEHPTQVSFREIVDGAIVIGHGIAYQDYIICGCCGGTIDIQELQEDYEEYAKEIKEPFPSEGVIQEHRWIPFNETISG